MSLAIETHSGGQSGEVVVPPGTITDVSQTFSLQNGAFDVPIVNNSGTGSVAEAALVNVGDIRPLVLSDHKSFRAPIPAILRHEYAAIIQAAAAITVDFVWALTNSTLGEMIQKHTFPGIVILRNGNTFYITGNDVTFYNDSGNTVRSLSITHDGKTPNTALFIDRDISMKTMHIFTAAGHAALKRRSSGVTPKGNETTDYAIIFSHNQETIVTRRNLPKDETAMVNEENVLRIQAS